MAQETSGTGAASGTLVIPGEMAARVDRLPMSFMAWEICLIVQVGWAMSASTDGIAARLYPFIWQPAKAITHSQYDVLYALQAGISILIGGYALGWLADKIGRRKALIISSVLAGVFIWPFGYVTNYPALIVLSVFDTLGFAGLPGHQRGLHERDHGPELAAAGHAAQPDPVHLPALRGRGRHPAALLVPGPLPDVPVVPGRREPGHRGGPVLPDAGVAALAGGPGAARPGPQGHRDDGTPGQQERRRRLARA